ncbi:MAG: hypothetical protein GX957_14530 [Clostridiaceae bacterium]|nr:hypothetical protein [Clostridiaceae bacterium]
MSHNFGLPDVSTGKNATGKTFFDEIYENDTGMNFDEALKRTKGLKPHFISGANTHIITCRRKWIEV